MPKHRKWTVYTVSTPRELATFYTLKETANYVHAQIMAGHCFEYDITEHTRVESDKYPWPGKDTNA